MHPLLLDIPEQLETERLTLKRYRQGDGEIIYNAIQQNLDHLELAIEGAKNGFGFDLTSLEGCEQYVRNHVACWEARKRFVLPFWDRASDKFVGELWIECKDWELGIHEIGYFVVESETGKGLATEATREGLKFIFEHLGADKCALTTDEDNVASCKVAERCGFVREGCNREATKRANGTRIGTLHYGMLKSEYVST